MRQFDLDEYLKDTTQKVVTRDGRSARIVCTDYIKRNYPVLALVSSDGEEFAYSFSTGGEFSLDHTDDIDLFFADKEPSYRPYANAEECFKDVVKHGGWVISGGNQYRQITGIGYGCNNDIVNMNGCNWMKFGELLEAIWADDGSPCGVKEG